MTLKELTEVMAKLDLICSHEFDENEDGHMQCTKCEHKMDMIKDDQSPS